MKYFRYMNFVLLAVLISSPLLAHLIERPFMMGNFFVFGYFIFFQIFFLYFVVLTNISKLLKTIFILLMTIITLWSFGSHLVSDGTDWVYQA